MLLFAGVLALAACVSAESWEAVRVLKDIEAGALPSGLKESTPAPSRRSLSYVVDGRASVADLYLPGQPAGASLVLVPGFAPDGKDDPRVIALANSLARGRFVVLVPNVAGSRDLRIRARDSEAIGDAVRHLASSGDRTGPLGVAAISYAVGPAILAVLEEDGRDEVDFIVGLGGYHDTTSIIAYMTTGAFRRHPDDDWRYKQPYKASKWIFLASNADALEDPGDRANLHALADRRAADPVAPVDDLAARLGPDGHSLLALMINDDPERTPALIDELPGSVRQEIEALSLAPRDLDRLSGRLILIHGLEDRMIPYTESIALAAAAGDTELFLVEDFSHIDPTTVGLFGRLTLIDAMQAILSRREFDDEG